MVAGQIAVSIPLNLTLSLYTAVQDPYLGQELLTQVLDGKDSRDVGIDEFSALAAFVLYEASNRTSFFRPFLCTLPKHVPLPIFQSQEDLAALEFATTGRFLRAVEAMGKVMVDNYIRTSDNLFDRRRDLFPTRPTLGAWLWASSVIFSRSWGVKPPEQHAIVAVGKLHAVHALAPLADMVNHDRVRGRKVVHATDGGFEVIAGQDLAPGDEIAISYGDKCNMELLAHYGFTIPGNPLSTCEWDSSLAKQLVATKQLGEAASKPPGTAATKRPAETEDEREHAEKR